MRCPSCNKFPAFDIGEPELDGIDCENGIITGSCRLVLMTQCCGDEAKETTFDIELDLSDEIGDALKEKGVEEPDLEGEGVEFSVISESANGDDRYQSLSPKGKPIKPRYQKHFYIASAEFEVKVKYPRGEGEETVEVIVAGTWTDECQASGMEELG